MTFDADAHYVRRPTPGTTHAAMPVPRANAEVLLRTMEHRSSHREGSSASSRIAHSICSNFNLGQRRG